jgi:UDP-GlcNAc:undecaprenyl-phosphate GlcNAc-1-phosphate transferase
VTAPLAADEIARILATFAVALVLSLALMPLAMALGRRLGFVVTPRLFDRGGAPIPYLGGKALAVSALAAFLVVWGRPAGVGSFLGGAIALLLLGFWDDRSKKWLFVNPPARMALQVAIAAAAFWSGFGADTGGWLGALGTVVFVLAAMNAFNLLDNMDGVAGSTGAAVALGITVVAMLGGQYMVGSLAAAMCGACLGFLRFNLRNARIYLGNGGSLFLGFLLAGLALQLRPSLSFPESLFVLPVLFAVPAMDTSVVILSRLANGRRVTQGGVDHVSHRLVRMGLDKLGAALVHAGASLAAGLFAAVAVVTGSVEILLGVLLAFAVAGITMLRLDMYSPAPLTTAPATETSS